MSFRSHARCLGAPFALFCLLLGGFDAAAAEASPSLAARVQQVLEARCLSCHGPDGRKGGLGLYSFEALREGGDSGPVVVPGDRDESLLLRKVTASNPADRMPPEGEPLSAEEIALIEAWIDAGAPGDGVAASAESTAQPRHWAFRPPERPVLPKVERFGDTGNPVDAFIRARLEEEGLEPSPEADRYTLIRRLSLDLVGLPPTPEEVAAFVADDRPDAYERLVDRLLASPHFGERRAVGWLDIARYADTNGYEKDRHRSIWPYRDWVIRAFDDDMPYDRFIVEQLAGDMLPSPTQDSRIATGFNRNSMVNEEGGVDVEEFRYEALVDRVNTTSTAFLGLTMACAQCHTHKFDPITQREYFQFLAFFDASDDVDMEVHVPEIAEERARIEAEIAELEARLVHEFPVDEYRTEWVPMRAVSAEAGGGAELKAGDDCTVTATGPVPAASDYTVEYTLEPGRYAALRLEVLPHPETGRLGHAEDGGFVVTGLAATLSSGSSEPARLVFTKAEADPAADGFSPEGLLDDKAETGWAVDGSEDSAAPAPTATLHLGEAVVIDEPSTLRVTLGQRHGEGRPLARFRLLAGKQVLPPSDLPEDVRRREHLERKFAAWEADLRSRSAEWAVADPIECRSEGNATFVKQADRSVLVKGDNPNTDTYEITLYTDEPRITAIRLEALPHPSLPGGGPGRGVIMAEGDFLLSEIAVEAAPWYDPDSTVPVTVRGASQDYAADGRTADLALDGRLDTGWSIKGATGQPHAAVFELDAPVVHDGPTLLRLKLDQVYVHQHTLGRFRISVTGDEGSVRASGVPADVEARIRIPEEERTDADRKALLDYYLSVAPETAEPRKRIDALRASMPSFPTTLVLEEREEPRITRIRHRGEFLEPRAPVTPDVPAVLPPLPEHAPRNRLTLALWLASEDNPLTARVAVNRLWQEYFGHGLVRTPGDFGLQGDPPTHPELLDWLATEFVRRGWSVKALTRLLVTSATYRQSSEATPELLAADPANDLYARSSRVRLDAEWVRDVALASSGLLKPTIGGPSFYPPLPDGVLERVFDARWKTSEGDELHRRGLYVYWKRTLPYPIATTFDAPARDLTCVQRVRSNTPLQALTLLNDPGMMEAARALARRILDEAPADTAARIRHAFLLTLARPPDPQELAWVAEFCGAQRAACETLGPGAEPEVWTRVARVLLNLDETITRP